MVTYGHSLPHTVSYGQIVTYSHPYGQKRSYMVAYKYGHVLSHTHYMVTSSYMVTYGRIFLAPNLI